MKKILQISAQKPDETGSGIFFKSLAKEMTKKGYEQAALVGINSKDKNYFENDNVEYYPVYFESKTLPFPVVGMSDVMPYKSTKYSDMDEEMLELWINEFKKVL